MMKRALITGITGQDGSYLAELLIEKGYEVHGIVRRSSTHNRERIDHLLDLNLYTAKKRPNPLLHHGNLEDSSSINKIVREIQADEIFNLGAQSQVRVSFEVPEETTNVDAVGALRVLEAIRNNCPGTRFYQASSSEMFGDAQESPQTEMTPFNSRSPYGTAKIFGFNSTVNYREAYGLHASNGILFNHESERRGESFVTRKITRNLTRIKLGLENQFFLGNLDAERDWGHAKDYVYAMWLMLQQDKPGDYVVGTGEKHSVREFLEKSIEYLNLGLKSNGKSGIDEAYFDEEGRTVIAINPEYFRPTEVDYLLADYSKAKKKLGWKPQIKFGDLVKIMVDSDLKLAEKEAKLK